MKSAEIAESFLIKELPAQVTHLTGVMTCDSHAGDHGDKHSVAVGKGGELRGEADPDSDNAGPKL